MCLTALATIVTPEPMRLLAQPAAQWAPVNISVGAEVNLFADWPGDTAADAVAIQAGTGWDIVSVQAVDLGRKDPIEFSVRRSVDGVVAYAPKSFSGPHRLIITLRAPTENISSTVSVTPAVRLQDSGGLRLAPLLRDEFEFNLTVSTPPQTAGRALRLSGRGTDPISVAHHIPSVRTNPSGLTVAFWMKSIDREKIVLSSWSGDEFEDYAFEFFLDAIGEIHVYSGHGGMHYSVGSGSPVADGAWHHVAYSIDFGAGRASMMLDGSEVDSRYLPDMSRVGISELVLGARQPENGSLTGMLDEIVLLPVNRSADEISRMARVPAKALHTEVGILTLDFEKSSSMSRRLEANQNVDLVESDLLLHQPATDIVAEFHPGSVHLRWVVEQPEAQTITIGRSRDGLKFESVHRVTIDQGSISSNGGPRFLSFEDFVAGESPIYFYRLQQEFDDKSLIQSAMIKIGVGSLDVPTAVELVGNSPNPFSTYTEVSLRVHEPTSLRLSVWSVSGHLVETLASETRDLGMHQIPFDAGDLPSGTYFLRLETDQGIQTHKMIVGR